MKLNTVALLSVLLMVPVSLAWSVDPVALRSKQDAQQRARTMTKELITNVLDIQIQQLEENGLEDLPLFKDIKSMRKNIDALVEAQMNEVVEVLMKGQQGTVAEREELFKKARTMIREIVLKLVAERQALLKRLKAAEIVAQIKRLIELETAAWKTTKAIPSEKQTRQEQLALTVIEDQRDVKELFLVLVESLVDVRSWGGPVGAGATDALRILKAANIGVELDQAGKNLETAKYEPANKNQEAIIKGLRQVLEKIEEAQGLINSDRHAALDLLRSITKQQEQVREQTQQAELQNQAKVDKPLIDQQAKVQQDLGKLAQALEQTAQDNPQVEPLLEHAKAAAEEARSELFEGKLADATQDQSKVLGALAELEQKLQQAGGADAHDQSAAQLAQEIKELEKAKEAVKQAREQQAQANDKAVQDPAAAKAAEEQAANKVAEVAKLELPKAVDSRLAEAEAAVKEAAAELATAEPTPQKNERAVEDADEALERAAAEIEAALADAQREEAAVKIGELARAAETLERAAAAERSVADNAGDAAKDKGLDKEQATDLKHEQAEIQKVTAKVAEAVKDLAPNAAKTLEQAQQSEAAVAQKLDQAAAQPGEATKPQAQAAAKGAGDASKQLSTAAAQLRDQIKEDAKHLAAITEEQLKAVGQAKRAVENTQAKLPETVADKMAKLEAAQAKVSQAQQDQQRAAGRPEAANSLALADQIGAAQEQQAAAEAAQDAFDQGKSNTPLDAAAQQQAVADDTKKLAEEAGKRPQAKAKQPDGLKEALEKAQAAAHEAARETLNGDKAKAEAARTEAKAALQQAQQLAAAEAEAAQAAPAGKPDPAAQQKVSSEIQEAKQLAGEAAPQAELPLATAGIESAISEQQLQAGKAETSAAAQQKTTQALDQADKKLAEAMKALKLQQAKSFGTEDKQTDDLAEVTATVDAGATGAVQSGEGSAEDGFAEVMEANSKETEKTQQAVERALEQAAANLAAREQQIRRDQAIAQTLAELADQQQKAADEINKQRDALDEAFAESKKSNREPATPQQRDAAEALNQATQDFAAAQRATGEGAEEISGQEEVANPPLREALELASNLKPENLPPVPLPEDSENGKVEGDAEPGEPGDENQPAGEGKGDHEGQKLGTKLVPNSPETTAKQIAGGKAMGQMKAAMRPIPGSKATNQKLPKSAAPGKPDAPGEDHEGQPADDPSAKAKSKSTPSKQTEKESSGREGGKTSEKGKTDKNEAVKDGPLDDSPIDRQKTDSKTDSSKEDAVPDARKYREEPWFAKLPPDLRKAIRAKSQRRAPKGYEDRLKKYFESID